MKSLLELFLKNLGKIQKDKKFLMLMKSRPMQQIWVIFINNFSIRNWYFGKSKRLSIKKQWKVHERSKKEERRNEKSSNLGNVKRKEPKQTKITLS